MRKFISSRKGQTSTEFIIIVAVLAVVLIGAMPKLRGAIEDGLSRITDSVRKAQ